MHTVGTVSNITPKHQPEWVVNSRGSKKVAGEVCVPKNYQERKTKALADIRNHSVVVDCAHSTKLRVNVT